VHWRAWTSARLRPLTALCGFVEAQADGIIQVFTGGGEFLSGTSVKDMVAGGRALAAFARLLSERCPVLVALPTEHSPPDSGMRQKKAHDPRPWGREAEGR